MTADDLPDALDQWPNDHHAILGVGRRAGEKEIKRAYAARIKRFKPERFPQHFRRLREAYERVLQINRWHVVEDEQEESLADSGQASALTTLGELEASNAEIETPPPAPDVRWERACSGEHAEVYAEYREVVELRPGDADSYVRLFWLLMAFPGLEAGMDPIEWLCRGVVAGADLQLLATLLSEDLLHRPGAAAQDAVAAAIGSKAPWPFRSRLAIQRWQAFVVAGEDPYRFVREGLAALAAEMDDEQTVKLAAVEALIPEGRNCASYVRSLLGEAAERNSDKWRWGHNRLDMAEALAEQTAKRSLRSLPRLALRAAVLVNAYANQAAQYVLWDYAERLASDPWTILDELAELFKEFPTAFYLVERGLHWLKPRNGQKVEREIAPEFWAVLESREFRRRAANRSWMFQFCIRFWVSPMQLHSGMEGRLPKEPLGAAADLLEASEDPVLALAWKIYALAWTDYEPDPNSPPAGAM